MANINETIEEVEKLNPELARQIKRYVKNHSYGLVFENNLPEAVRLYKKAVMVGDTVNILPDRGNEEKDENKESWIVRDIKGENATIEREGSQKTVSVKDVVTLVSYRDVIYPGLKELDRIERGDKDDPYHMVINSENYHALEMLTYCYAGKVDCIYIDPPYNNRSKDWKYNNDYVDANDQYKHSKWLAFMQRRLRLAKNLLNPQDSMLIVTIDERECARLSLLLEQNFPEARIQMVDSVINRKGVSHKGTQKNDEENEENEEITQFSRVSEFIFFVMLGKASIVKQEYNMLGEEDEDDVAEVVDEKVQWLSMLRRGSASRRADKAKHFYPIFVDGKTATIVGVGDPIPLEQDRNTVKVPKGLTAVWPMRTNGSEGRWQLKKETFERALSEGWARLGTYNKRQDRWAINYLNEGTRAEIDNGFIEITGKDDKGAWILKRVETKLVEPKAVWNKTTHNASEYGTTLLNDIIGSRIFDYPKSLYAVADTLRFSVGEKKEALIIDFFAGSGTTLQATNLLNFEDGGKRRCICVTNNEVSYDETKGLIDRKLRPGDSEWEKNGIAMSATWPRTKLSIQGKNFKGEELEGGYIGYNLQMSEGFKANAIFCELSYENSWPIRLDAAFDAIAPILWMLAGCRGEIIRRIGKSYLTTDYYGVLFDYNQASKFCEKIKATPTIKTVFVVTDDQRRYSNICKRLPNVEVHRLYETFLRTFEICGEGGLD